MIVISYKCDLCEKEVNENQPMKPWRLHFLPTCIVARKITDSTASSSKIVCGVCLAGLGKISDVVERGEA